MKTILIAHNYTQDSFAVMSYSLAHHLANKGNKVVFVSHKPFFQNHFQEDVKQGELIVYSWPTANRPTTLKDALWYLKIHKKHKPDTVIAHFVNVNITVPVSKIMSLGKVKTLPYYHTLSSQINMDSNRSRFNYFYTRLRMKLVYNLFCDQIICPSDLAKQDLLGYFGTNKGLKVLNPMQDRFQRKESLPQNEITIVYLGRIDNSKGVIEMVRAFNSYCLLFPETIIRIKIAGSGSGKEELLKLINQNDKINYVGGIEYGQVDFYLNKAHYTIIPSVFDNLPTVGLESLMNQTPLLISKTTGLSLELTSGHECYMFDSNENSMIQLFEKVENEIHLQKQMSLNAREAFLKKFTFQTYHQSIENLI